MTALKAGEVERFVRSPDISDGIVLAYGPDGGLVREVAQRLTRHFAGPDGETVILDGADLDSEPGRLALEARSASLFASRRVVRVRNAGKSAVMALAELKDDPAGATIVLEAGNLAPRDPLRALVEGARSGRALPCYPDDEASIARLVGDTFSKAGVAIAPEALQHLRDSLGNDREITRRELEKLVLFSSSSKRLTLEDVLALTGDNGAVAIDAVLDAIGTGHPDRLDNAVARAMADGASPQQMLILALNHFAQLRRWRTEVDAGRSVRDVLDGARPRPHFSRRSSIEQQLRSWPDAALQRALQRLLDGVAQSRKRYDLQEPIARRTLTAVALMAAEA
jgi:DNA polymerase III subunit delta